MRTVRLKQRGKARLLRRTVASVAALALVLAACGGDEPAVSDAPTTSDAEPSTSDDSPAEADEPAGNFYEGGRLEVLIAHGTGGGTDIQGRFVGDWLVDMLPGDPRVVYDNVSGGGTLIGANAYASRPADGFHLWFSSASTTYQAILGHPEVRFDFNDYQPVIGVPAGSVVYGSPAVGDFTDQQQTFIHANQDPAGLALTMLLGYDILGIDHQAVFGYSSGERVIAVESGEALGAYATVGQYQELVRPLEESGQVRLFYTAGQLQGGQVVRDPAWPDVPSIAEVYEDMHGEAPSGEAWEAYKALLNSGYTLQKILWVHRDAPQEAKDALAAAAAELAANDEFRAEGEVVLEYDIMVGQELEDAVADMLAVDPAVIEWLLQYLIDEYDFDITN